MNNRLVTLIGYALAVPFVVLWIVNPEHPSVLRILLDIVKALVLIYWIFLALRRADRTRRRRRNDRHPDDRPHRSASA